MQVDAVSGQGVQPLLGYFGKVPTHGDFVRQGLPKAFLDPWDNWLQRAISSSKEQLSDAWLHAYLTSPVWRFTLSAGVCGEAIAAGTLMPSVDAVGRYYPMTIASIFPDGVTPFHIANAAWLSAAQDATLSCLEKDFELEAFETRLGEIRDEILNLAEPDGLGVKPWSPPSQGLAQGLAWSMDEMALDQLASEVYPALLHSTTEARLGAYSIWWTDGSDNIPPCLRLFEGLPSQEAFSELLTVRLPDSASL